MKLREHILPRLRDEHLKPDFIAAGLKGAYYPAPAKIIEGPTAVFFIGGGDIITTREQTWESIVRAQYLIPASGYPAQAASVLDGLIEVIIDHFAPDTDARFLRVPGQPGMVNQCDPNHFDASQIIQWAGGAEYDALIVTFSIKHHRNPGEEDS